MLYAGSLQMGKRKIRRVAWRSHRRARQVLFAFGLAGLGLGCLLLLLYGYFGQGILLWLGLVYIMVACLLLGVRRILGHLDDLRRWRQQNAEGRELTVG
jgi:fatty acid desaturase